MKSLFLSASLVALTTLSATATAASTIYQAADSTSASKLCEIAGNQGLADAKQFADENGIDFNEFRDNYSCNGKNITKFGKATGNKSQKQRPITLIASNDNQETRLCIQAAEMGTYAISNGAVDMETLNCNGKSVSDFVKDIRRGE